MAVKALCVFKSKLARASAGQLRACLRAAAVLLVCGLATAAGAQSLPGQGLLGRVAAHRGQLAAGTTYTSADGKGAPQFPEIDMAFVLRGADGSPAAARPGELALYLEGQQVGRCTGIRSFDRTGYGVTRIVVVDANGALRAVPAGAVESAIAILTRQTREQDRIAVMTLAEDVRTELPMHAGPPFSAGKALALHPRGKSTRLYDGLYETLGSFASAPARRRQLVVISDGRDQDSQHTLADVALRARALGATIDAIGLAQGVDNMLATLQQLSVASGGVYVRAQSAPQLQQYFALGAAGTMATPVATFELSHIPEDGQLISLQLRWTRGGLSAPAFLQTPKVSNALHLPSGNSPSAALYAWAFSPWTWGFCGCFLLGVVLFLFSFGGRVRSEGVAGTSEPARVPVAPAAALLNGAASAEPPTARYNPIYQPRYVEAEAERRKSEYSARFDPPPQGPYARLVIKNNALAGREVLMTHAIFAIGALPVNDLMLPGDLTISGRHLRLYWENGALTVEDNHSTNGTYLNRLRVPAGRHTLKPGDEIGVGQTFLVMERA